MRPGALAAAAAGPASTMRPLGERPRVRARPASRGEGRRGGALALRGVGEGAEPGRARGAGARRTLPCSLPRTGGRRPGGPGHRWRASPTQWMSLWRHESSSCRKPRLSTEHCCRLHTLAIFCRPPGPASAAAPRTPSRVARGRARTRGLGVAPPAGGGAGARLRSPPRGPVAARSSSRPPARRPRAPALRPTSRPPAPPGTASFYAGARSPRRPRSPGRPRWPRPSPGLLGFKLVPSITSYLPIGPHQLLQVPHHCFSQLLGRNGSSHGGAVQEQK